MGQGVRSVSQARVCIYILLVLVLFIGGCGGTAAGPAAKGKAGVTSIRVLVIDGASKLTIKGARGYGKSVVIRAGAGGRVLVGGGAGAAQVTFTPGDRFLHIDGKPDRGTVKVTGHGGRLRVVNTLSLEAYVAGIINGEISSKWHQEVVKAQAVAARSYAYFQITKRSGELFDVTNTTMDQVYAGVGAEDRLSVKAVRATRGEVLFYDGEPVLALFHSNAGGRTEAAGEVWGRDYPYLRSVKSRFDTAAPRYSWKFTVTREKLGELLT